MRLLPVLLTVLAWTSTAGAQDRAPTVDPAPVPVSASAQAPAPAQAAVVPAAIPPDTGQQPAPARKTRITWEQRFAQANMTHDGHLTLEQAKGGYAAVARHFPEIDLAKKGFVTEDDIRAWHKAQRAARRGQSGGQSGGQSAEGSNTLHPQQAFQRFFPTTMQINTGTDRTVPNMDRAPEPAPETEAGSDAKF